MALVAGLSPCMVLSLPLQNRYEFVGHEPGVGDDVGRSDGLGVGNMVGSGVGLGEGSGDG